MAPSQIPPGTPPITTPASLLQSVARNVFGFLGVGVGIPAPVRAYNLEKIQQRINPFYNFDEGSYTGAPVLEPDYRMSETCFKGTAEQNLDAVDRELEQSTLATDLATVVGSQPTECMPHKVTRNYSPLDLNPWYLISVMSPAAREPYQDAPGLNEGNPMRGGDNPIHHRQRMVLPTNSMQVGCALELMVTRAGGAPDTDDPTWMRRELDNCLNQYILQHSRFIRDPDDNIGEYFGTNWALCQPFDLVVPPTRHERYEYIPTEYIGVAWIKLLMDSNYRHRDGRSAAEPHYRGMTGVDVIRQIRVPAEKFGLILVEDLAELSPINLHFEKISDPSHPYTPRWDFTTTDRSFSPLTTGYRGNPRNAVRCDDEVPVDLLEFRRHMFDRWIFRKVGFNTFCYNNWWCRNFIWRPLRCTSGAPCCATRWNDGDKFPDFLSRRLICGIPMHEICNYIARPLTGVNTLKLREVTDETFPEGVAEGYTFKEYFGDHKPYMRCWDTNTECGAESQVFPRNVSRRGSYNFLYNPGDTLGSEYALMGVGREIGIDDLGESCNIGGGLGRGGVANPDPISSWSELKLYYVRSMRRGINCLSAHTKLMKDYGTEAFILRRGGTEVQIKTLTPPSAAHPQGTLANYRTIAHPLGWRGYVSDPDGAQRFPNFGGRGAAINTGLDDAVPGDLLIFDQDVVQRGGRGTWRNPYVATVTEVVNRNYVNAITNPARAATHAPELDYVKAIAHDHGKFIDACGHSDEMGMGTTYTMFKSELPPPYPRFLDETEFHTKECDDPRLSACIEPLWNDIKRYNLEANIGN